MKRSQIKMGENIAIMFIFFLIIVFGISFYMKVMRGQSAKAAQEQFELQAIEVSERFNFLTEVQCSVENIIEEGCYDILKVKSLSNMINSSEYLQIYYYDEFKFSTVMVHEIYPNQQAWILYDREPKDVTGDPQWIDQFSINIPVSLFDPFLSSSGGYAYGYLNVRVYRI